MGAFSGLKDAKRGFNSNPLRPGKYLVRVDETRMFEAEKKGIMVKVTATVLAVEEGEHKVGEVVHIFYKRGENKAVFLSNVKSFIAGVLDVADEEIGEEDAEKVMSDEQPMAGLVTLVTAVQQTSKDKKNDAGEPLRYTKYAYSASLSDEEIADAIGPELVAKFFPNA